eukprot:gene24065-30364_t
MTPQSIAKLPNPHFKPTITEGSISKREAYSSETVTLSQLDGFVQQFIKDTEAGLPTISEVLASKSFPTNWSVYTYSKIALIAATRVYARDPANSRVLINASCPGYCATDLNYNAGPRPPAEGAKTPVLLALLPEGSTVTGRFYEDEKDSECAITDATLLSLSTAQCSSEIISLNLSYCDISDTGLLAVADSCSSLQTLSLNSQYMQREDLSKSRVTDRSLVALGRQCRELSTLSLCCEYFPNMTETGMVSLVESASSLTSLSLSQSYKYSNNLLAAISDNATLRSQLRELDLSRCNQYSALGVRPLAQFCTGVTSLDLSGCVGINHETLMAVAESFPALNVINIDSCEHSVLDVFIHKLCAHHPLLIDLSVSHATRLTSSAIDSITTHCKQIKALNISYNHKIHDDSIIKLIDNCTALTNLNMRDCAATVRSISHAIRLAPRLSRLRVTGCTVSESELQTLFSVEKTSLEILFCKLEGGSTVTYQYDNFRIVREY